jgi:predicted transcriptional regulator YheO
MNPTEMTEELSEWLVARASSIRGKSTLDGRQRATLLTPIMVVLREEGGMNMHDIAVSLGVSTPTVSRYLRAFYG